MAQSRPHYQSERQTFNSSLVTGRKCRKVRCSNRTGTDTTQQKLPKAPTCAPVGCPTEERASCIEDAQRGLKIASRVEHRRRTHH
jgi:hypothetical protein